MRLLPVDSDEERDSRRARQYPRVTTAATDSSAASIDSEGSPPLSDTAAGDNGDGEEDDNDDGEEELLATQHHNVRLLSNDALCDVMDDTFNNLRQFRLSGRSVSCGAPFMGWSDQRQVDGTRVKFQLRKHFARSSVQELSDKTWRWLSDPQHVLRRFNTAARGQTLQRVNDDLQIARHDAPSADGTQLIRCVYVLCRMRTRRGFIICVQSFNPWAATPSALEPDPHGRDVLVADVLGFFRFDAGAPRSSPSTSGYGSSSSSGSGYSSSSSENEIERRRAAPGVSVEWAGTVDFGEASAVATLVMASLWMAVQWESLVVAPLFHVAAC